MSDGIKITLSGFGEVRALFEAMPERVRGAMRNPELHQKFVLAIIADARERIDSGGNPTPFEPLKPATLKRRKPPVKILRDTSNLYNQMNYAGSEGNTAYLGVVRYFFAHQFGANGSVSIAAHRRMDKRGDRFTGRAKRKTAKNTQTASGVNFAKAHTRRINIPARPIVVITPELLNELGGLTAAFVREEMGET